VGLAYSCLRNRVRTHLSPLDCLYVGEAAACSRTLNRILSPVFFFYLDLCCGYLRLQEQSTHLYIQSHHPKHRHTSSHRLT
jgi:hypothetical protein